MILARHRVVKAGIVGTMKKLSVVLLLAALVLLLTRRRAAPHMHGTPDHWPPVPRRAGTPSTAA